MDHELAEVNIARLAAPLDSDQLRDFVDALEPINALADTSPGFVWRLQGDEGDATSIPGFEADTGDSHGVIVNLSTWIDIDSLAAFAFGPMHAAIMRRRREWFQRMREAYLVCWWVPAGHRPTVAEAEDRLARLRADGPTPDAFTLRHHFPPPGVDPVAAASVTERDDWLCSV